MKISYHYPLMLAMVGALGLMWISSVPQADAHPDYGCSSCHVPHGALDDAKVPLWNPAHATTTDLDESVYYGSVEGSAPTMDATAEPVNGASLLCLSCHDGSYSHVSIEHSFTDETTTDPDTGDTINAMGGLDNSHPISFVYDAALAAADGELVDPAPLVTEGILDSESRVQCTSCHDVHKQDFDYNLRWDYSSGYGITAAFCRNCHAK